MLKLGIGWYFSDPRSFLAIVEWSKFWKHHVLEVILFSIRRFGQMFNQRPNFFSIVYILFAAFIFLWIQNQNVNNTYPK